MAKHIIVIETPDTAFLDTEDRKRFQERCIDFCEMTTEHCTGFGNSFIQSRFFQESAVEAVKEMYDVE